MKKLKLVKLSLLMSAVLNIRPVMADNFLSSEYQVGKNKVAFLSENTRIAGNIFIPPNYIKTKHTLQLQLVRLRAE